ncbi:MAG TPA: hypothetical protein VKF36_00770 [Syntrophorhabdales bacterium]|nr:hypothetical protein [Syntrophorhabdales bacterium]
MEELTVHGKVILDLPYCFGFIKSQSKLGEQNISIVSPGSEKSNDCSPAIMGLRVYPV